MIMTTRLGWDGSSLMRQFIGGGKPRRQIDVDNIKLLTCMQVQWLYF